MDNFRANSSVLFDLNRFFAMPVSKKKYFYKYEKCDDTTCYMSKFKIPLSDKHKISFEKWVNRQGRHTMNAWVDTDAGNYVCAPFTPEKVDELIAEAKRLSQE